jgi:hypothetical protein
MGFSFAIYRFPLVIGHCLTPRSTNDQSQMTNGK